MNETDSLLSAAGFVPERLNFPNSWCGHLPFACWLTGRIRPSVFVELGTHTGNSYLGFCQSVKAQGLTTRCFAIDTWAGDAHAGNYDDTVYVDLKTYHDPLYGSFSRLMRMTFDEAIASFEDKSVDLLHIDGLHTYDAVRHDFETWLPKLAPGAIVLFHDTHVFDRGFGVWKFWEELCARYPEHLSFAHSNGLGVLRIGVPKHDWLAPDSEAQARILEYFSSLGKSTLLQYDNLEKSERISRLLEEEKKHRAWEAKLEADFSALKQDALQQQALNKFLAHQVAEMRRSTSWKITAPLRIARRLLRGDLKTERQNVDHVLKHLSRRLPLPAVRFLEMLSARLVGIFGGPAHSPSNQLAIADIVAARCAHGPVDPMTASLPEAPPEIDICVVTYNSSRWVQGFTESLVRLDYPRKGVTVRFVDNGSTDDTFQRLQAASEILVKAGYGVEIMKRPNRGFGAGQNVAISSGSAPFCLITNIDLEFEPDSLAKAVAMACADNPTAAAWEFRQKPYEHPKFYDPVTGSTNWNSHACVLLRRSALEEVGGYDEILFMYGEDVELSYRLRRKGHALRYCPLASVHHYSHEDCGKVKPLQYSESTFANLYLRVKYGKLSDMLAVPVMGIRLAFAPEAYPGSRKKVLMNLARLLAVLPKALLSRRSSHAHFPFHDWDYELTREGAFVLSEPLSGEKPMVSVITRTYQGRESYLRQALLSVSHQTYPCIEHIVVEDGGASMKAVAEEVSKITGKKILYRGLEKVGRSAAGNAGLELASSRWCLFLDDDDLLFADHIELLVNALQRGENAAATYSLSWEIVTDAGKDGRYEELAHNIPMTFRQPFDHEVLSHHNFMSIQSVLFERSLYLERGGFEVDIECLEDWMLWVKYAHGNRFEYVPKVTSMFRTPSDSALIDQRMALFDAAYPVAVSRNMMATGKKIS
ncbi:glycosyltransferase [Ferrovum sp.]|uniref:glycosyltransferase n=1 Tax=Ferrovum sp. TaxID=2609467 RepID=UPI002609DE63|nr:glycosyltransferase [Ferrovum sp.]